MPDLLVVDIWAHQFREWIPSWIAELLSRKGETMLTYLGHGRRKWIIVLSNDFGLINGSVHESMTENSISLEPCTFEESSNLIERRTGMCMMWPSTHVSVVTRMLS